ncbi:MAG: MATE family efflux transporter [Clostridiales Family XIII bacterium]|jgi:putative MATE family efflux protein|nr:MATE family efflux transporter [Clostridiales Family XIII bacterium]
MTKRLDNINGQGGERLLRTLVRVALPIAAQSMISSSLNLVDNLIVGRLGETALASVGLSVQIFFIHWMVMFGFSSGAATFMAQFWGKRDLANIRRAVGIAVSCCFAASLLLFFLPAMLFPGKILGIFTNIPEVIAAGSVFVRINAISFLTVSFTVPFTAALRATQQTHIPLRISIAVFGLNTLLNYTFVYGNFGAPALGVAGSALATAIARLTELVLVIVAVFGLKNKIAGPLREFTSWASTLFRRICGNALPTTLNETLWGIGMSMYNAAYGRIGVTAFAAVQASGTIQNLFILACFSLGEAILIIVGERLGQGDLAGASRVARKLMKICVLIGFAASVLLFATSRGIILLFDLTPEGAECARLILAIYSLFLVVKIFNSAIVTGVLRCGGDTTFAMLADVGTVWLVGVPLAFFGALWLKLPVYYVVLIVQADEFVKLFLTGYRFLSDKWVRNLVHDIG